MPPGCTARRACGTRRIVSRAAPSTRSASPVMRFVFARTSERTGRVGPTGFHSWASSTPPADDAVKGAVVRASRTSRSRLPPPASKEPMLANEERGRDAELLVTGLANDAHLKPSQLLPDLHGADLYVRVPSETTRHRRANFCERMPRRCSK